MLKPYAKPNRREAGCDEAGRGCLAGSVYAAAVILPPGFTHEQLNDSKQLSAKMRETLRREIEQAADDWAVGIVTPEEIDRINILRASILAMHRALSQLRHAPEFILVDGNKFTPYEKIPHETVVKGDATYLSIAAASILAKTHRDEYMHTLHQDYPYYGWNKNAGYPTRQHRRGIAEHGISPFHRKSFRLLPEDSRDLFEEIDTEI